MRSVGGAQLLHSSITATVGEHDPAARLIVTDAQTRFPEPAPPVRQGHSPADQARLGPPQPQPPARPDPRRPRATPPVSPPQPADDDWDERLLMEEI